MKMSGCPHRQFGQIENNESVTHSVVRRCAVRRAVVRWVRERPTIVRDIVRERFAVLTREIV